MNKAMLEINGYGSLGELSHLSLLDLVTPEYREAVRENIESKKAGRPIPPLFEYKILRKDGTTRFVQSQSTAITINNEPLMQITFRDITQIKMAEEERKRLEIQVQQTQKLESLGILAGGIAHDFNNILQIILANVNLMQRLIPETNLVLPFIQKMEKSINRAKDLTHQMLAYAGRSSFSVRMLNPGDTVREIVRLIQPLISKKVVLKTEIGNGLPFIEADLSQIQQVVMNLLLNASESLNEEYGGMVIVSVTTRHCTREYLCGSRVIPEAPEGDYVCIEVTDSGCGMNEETVEKMFDPFFTTKFTGRGLGMSAVLGIIRAHKGAVLVDSMPDRGTSVRVLFPAKTNSISPTKEKEQEVLPIRQQGPGVILFAEDEPDMAEMGKLMLKDMGYTVFLAEDGLAALRLFEAHSEEITCAVLDLSMPKMDGLQTSVEIRRIKPGLKIVLMSGYAKQEVESRIAGLHIDAFLAKPFTLQSLSEVVRKVVE